MKKLMTRMKMNKMMTRTKTMMLTGKFIYSTILYNILIFIYPNFYRRKSDDHAASSAEFNEKQKEAWSFLHRKYPKKHERSHDRAVPLIRKTTGKRRKNCHSKHESKNISPEFRVSEFRSEPFSLSNKKLFCDACNCILSVRR